MSVVRLCLEDDRVLASDWSEAQSAKTQLREVTLIRVRQSGPVVDTYAMNSEYKFPTNASGSDLLPQSLVVAHTK